MTSSLPYFDPMKNFEAFSKFNPAEMLSTDPVKQMGEFFTKAREASVEMLNKNVDLTVDWMKEASKDAETLMTPEEDASDYMKKASELAASTVNTLPSRLFAYAEVAKKAQFDMLDTVLVAAQPVAKAPAEPAKKTTKKTA